MKAGVINLDDHSQNSIFSVELREWSVVRDGQVLAHYTHLYFAKTREQAVSWLRSDGLGFKTENFYWYAIVEMGIENPAFPNSLTNYDKNGEEVYGNAIAAYDPAWPKIQTFIFDLT